MQFILEFSTSGDVYVLELDVKPEVKAEPAEERALAPWSPPPTSSAACTVRPWPKLGAVATPLDAPTLHRPHERRRGWWRLKTAAVTASGDGEVFCGARGARIYLLLVFFVLCLIKPSVVIGP